MICMFPGLVTYGHRCTDPFRDSLFTSWCLLPLGGVLCPENLPIQMAEIGGNRIHFGHIDAWTWHAATSPESPDLSQDMVTQKLGFPKCLQVSNSIQKGKVSGISLPK